MYLTSVIISILFAICLVIGFTIYFVKCLFGLPGKLTKKNTRKSKVEIEEEEDDDDYDYQAKPVTKNYNSPRKDHRYYNSHRGRYANQSLASDPLLTTYGTFSSFDYSSGGSSCGGSSSDGGSCGVD